MTAPSAHDDVSTTLRGLVPEWEFGCCAPRPVVGGTTWWRWTFDPQLTPHDPSEAEDRATFTRLWSLSSIVELPGESRALQLRSSGFVAWWPADQRGHFTWLDSVLGRRQVPASTADALVGRTMALRGRLLGGRHGGGPDDSFPYIGARVLGLCVLGRRWRVETDRARTLVGYTARREPVGPPRFHSYPESVDPPIVRCEDSLLMELEALTPAEVTSERRNVSRARTLPVGELRDLLAAVAPLAAGESMTAINHTAQPNFHLPPDFRPPRHPHEWTTQETDLVDDRPITTFHRSVRVRTIGPNAEHPHGAERVEFPDGLPLAIHSGRDRWRFCHWPNDTFFVPGDPELTAVHSVRDHVDDRLLPPRPTDAQSLLGGEEPLGEIRATTVDGRPCWTYTMAGPERRPWAVTRVIVDAATGWLVAESHVGHRQVRWSDVRVVTSPTVDDVAAFAWTGAVRPVETFRNSRRTVHPVRPT